MFQDDAKEAVPICRRVLTELLTQAPARGRPGSDLRTAIGDFLANAYELIRTDSAGLPLDNIFRLARMTGIPQRKLAIVRAAAEAEAPVSVGATLVQNALIRFALATEARVIADIIFTSRGDVELTKENMNAAFAPAEEIAADEMAQTTYQALVGLHAAVINHLVETARPLPRLLNFQFVQTMTTLTAAYRLYADASRADELRAENKVVHPLFMRRAGRGLSG